MKLAKQPKLSILLSIFALGIQACSDSDQKNGLTDPTAKASDVAADDIPLVTLGRDGAITMKVDIAIPSSKAVVFDNNKIEEWNSNRGIEIIGISKPVCSFWSEIKTEIKAGELYAISSSDLDVTVAKDGKPTLKQSIFLRDKDDNLIGMGCAKPFTSVSENIFTIKDLKAIAGNLVEISDLEKNILPFAFTPKADEGSIFSKIAPGSQLKSNDPNLGSENNWYQNGKAGQVDHNFLYGYASSFNQGTQTVQAVTLKYRFKKGSSLASVGEDITIAVEMASNTNWYLNAQSAKNSKNFPLQEYLDVFGAGMLEIVNGSPLSFGIVLR